MIWVIVTLLGLLLLCAGALYAVATRRAIKAAGQPTAEDAKIEAKTKSEALAIVNDGDKEKTEVLRANSDGLLARLRARVRKQ